ncbi:MAG: YafY family transcriptional regulator [Ignavibacteria bacterium]|nr:YafY family transcriptional regulator [Ignavibacteria bacterium]MCU7522430.1 YafY family transcriptional regulator [Ignavibacteria bacterium]
MRIDRMLGIVVLLLNRNKITAKELSRRFEVSVRTVYRDIEAINMAGIPIISFPGSKGGLGIMENYRLNGQVLSLDDMGSIISTLRNVNRTLGNTDLEAVSEKILNLIPKDKIDYVKRQPEEFCIDLIPWSFRDKYKDFIKILQCAISESRVTKFFYRNTRGEAMTRIVEPMTLVFKGYAWYLFAFCRNRSDYRIFKLSRIEGIDVLPERFTRKDVTYHEAMKSQTPPKNLVNITLKFSPLMRPQVEEFFEGSIVKTLDDGSFIASVTFPEDEWVYTTILSFGEYAEVLEPVHIKEKLREKIKKMSLVYNADMMLSQH